MRGLALIVALTLATPAIAAPTPADDGILELKKKAEDAFKSGQYKVALDQYVAAAKRSNDPALLYNIARCHHELGDFAEAHAYYTRFALEAPVDLRAKVPHLDEKIALVASKTALLKITVNVPGATLTVDGRSLGEAAALTSRRVNAGRVRVVAAREGYDAAEQTLEVVAATTVDVRLELRERAGLGTLKVSSNVDGTRVTVDDRAVGRTPLTIALPAGAHRLEAIADGYEPWRRTVTLSPGAIFAHDVTLTASSRSTWWVWAGVGVVVVGGVVLSYALLSEKSGSAGSYAPGRISAGLIRF